MLYSIEHKQRFLYAQTLNSLTSLPHIHPHLELIYLLEGSGTAVADHKEAVYKKGDIFLAFPNQVHFYHVPEPVKAIMLIFSADLVKDLKEVLNNNVPVSPVIANPSLSFDAAELMTAIMKKHKSDLLFDKTMDKGYLLALLGELLPLMTLVQNTSDQDSIKQVLHYCLEHYTEPLTLDSIADALHLNKYYISHMFKERMNISFLNFLNGMRTEHACNLLEKGETITEAAFSSGFSSIRNFNRIFAQNMGMTPREYAKARG